MVEFYDQLVDRLFSHSFGPPSECTRSVEIQLTCRVLGQVFTWIEPRKLLFGLQSDLNDDLLVANTQENFILLAITLLFNLLVHQNFINLDFLRTSDKIVLFQPLNYVNS